MTTMTATGVFLIVLLSVVDPKTFPDRSAIVNETVTLPCTCSGKVVKWIIIFPVNTTITTCRGGTCEINEPFEKRLSFSGNTSSGNFDMSIISTLYNDAGTYSCTCNGKVVSEGKLHVSYPHVVPVFEGQNITLPCYGDTRKDAKDVEWRKDGEKLLKYASATPEEASAGRFSVSNQTFQDGDLSLHISLVELSDAGFYQCLIHDESRDGDPRAVLLKVKKHQQESQPATTPNSCIQYLGIGIAVGLTIAFIGPAVYLNRRKRPCGETSVNVGNPIQEEFSLIPMKPSSTQIIQD